MPRRPRIQTINLNPLPAGMATKFSKYSTPKWQKLENWWPSPDDFGSIEVVPGISDFFNSELLTPFDDQQTDFIGYMDTASPGTYIYFVSDGSSTKTLKAAAGTSMAGGIVTGDVVDTTTSATVSDVKDMVIYDNIVYFLNGSNPVKFEAQTVPAGLAFSSVGLTQPSTSSITTTASTASINVVGNVKYWYSEMTGEVEGPLSPSFGLIDCGSGQSVSLATLPTSKSIRLYRSTRDAEVPLFLTALDTSSYVDSVPDEDLGELPPIMGEGPPTSLKTPIVHFNRIWAFKEFTSRVYWSDFANPESWFEENHLNINEGDGDYITCLARTHNGFYAFKNNHIYRIIGRDPNAEIFQITEALPSHQQSDLAGVRFPDQLVSTPIGHVFYYEGKVFALQENALRYLSEEIEDELKDIEDGTAGTRVILGYVPTYRLLLVSVPDDDETYCYLIDRDSWFKISQGFRAIKTVEFNDGSSNIEVFTLALPPLEGGTGDYLLKLFDEDATDFDGTAISSEAVLPPLFLGSPGSFSEFLWATIMFEAKASGNFVVNYKFDGEATGTDVTVSQVKANLARWFERVNLGQQATQVELTFKTTTDQPRTKIFGLTIEGQELGTYNV